MLNDGHLPAAEYLNGTLGPARTTVSVVAGRAGVTRATVYRHFAAEESLFLACSCQSLSRLRASLLDIYRFYRVGEQMMAHIHHDVDVVPAIVVAARRSREQLWLETLLAPQPSRRKMVRAAIAHATAFTTGQSLCGTQGLSHRSAVELMVARVEHISP